MRLLELEPQLLTLTAPGHWSTAPSFEEADGLFFLCPVCFQKNGGPIGTHAVVCWRPRVPQTEDPKPGRWEWQGNSFTNLTLVAGSSSIRLMGGCNAHFFVRDGRVILT